MRQVFIVPTQLVRPPGHMRDGVFTKRDLWLILIHFGSSQWVRRG